MASFGLKLNHAEVDSSTTGRRHSALASERRRSFPSCWVAATAAAIATAPAQMFSALGQEPPATPSSITCPDDGQDLLTVPVIQSSGGILTGTIVLTDEQQRLQESQRAGASRRCAPQWLRVFRAAGSDPSPKAKPESDYLDPMPGPTLRARVGEIVQLTLLNQINSNRYDPNIDREACIRVLQGNTELYPGVTKDVYANCLHASSTANIHFHGTHTNPNATGDNVFLQIRPLPRNNAGDLAVAPTSVTASLDDFFKECAEQLSKNPLKPWPTLWGDLPKSWRDKQMELLLAHDQGVPPYKPPAKPLAQQLLPPNQEQIDVGQWPQYYIGAYPFCFALPSYAQTHHGERPIMGQAPGIHWYHAHKHGSTAINVANGMTGAFIIEGEYDDELNANYAKYVMKDDKEWHTRSQPVIVVNQLGADPNLLGGRSNVDFSVNGRIRPRIQMQPGEIQLWRIVNTSGRSAIYFQAPEGFEWMQLAQDGVQFADVNYQRSRNRPIYMAPGNRADLLVKAPNTGSAKVLIQNVMALADVKPIPLAPTPADRNPGIPLMTIEVAGRPVLYEGTAAEMPFPRRAPAFPKFLENIGDAELKKHNYPTRRLVFNSKPRASHPQHTINDLQFESGHVNVTVQLNTVEEWTIVNTTNDLQDLGPGNIDHPFHIHVNPFQVTEVFDPNESLVDPNTGKLVAVLDSNNKTQPVPRYVTSEADFSKVDELKRRQCFLDPKNSATWRPCGETAYRPHLVWWDVFRIPSARVPRDANNQPLTDADGKPIVIPGHFKMRSRFVDYAGYYVLHCHILVHEDRGMMFVVEVMRQTGAAPRHH